MSKLISSDSNEDSRQQALRLERGRQVRGSLLLAGAVLVFAVMRAGVHRVFTVGWWRLW